MKTAVKKPLYLAIAGILYSFPSMAVDVSVADFNAKLYGLLDIGVSSVSNQAGDRTSRMDDGIYTPSLIGLEGGMDIDDDLKAVFVLETQIDLGEGNTIPNNNRFWRQSHVGLSSKQYGTVSLGTQLDFMWDSLAPALNDPALIAGGLYNFSAGPFAGLNIPNNPTGYMGWDRTEAARLHNTIKYQSPTWEGLSAGALYGFNEDSPTGARSFSSGLRYDQGPAGFGAAFTEVHYGVKTTIRNWGVGGHYGFDGLLLSSLVSSAKNKNNKAEVQQIRIGGNWAFSDPYALGLVYSYMDGNKQLNNNHAHQIGATLSRKLKKNFLIYAQTVYQKTNKDANAHIMGIMSFAGASSNSTQSILRLGIQWGF